jgi:hypothetical protein
MGAAGRIRIEKYFNVATNTNLVANILQKRAIKDSTNLKPLKNLNRLNNQSLVREIINEDSLQKKV